MLRNIIEKFESREKLFAWIFSVQYISRLKNIIKQMQYYWISLHLANKNFILNL